MQENRKTDLLTKLTQLNKTGSISKLFNSGKFEHKPLSKLQVDHVIRDLYTFDVR